MSQKLPVDGFECKNFIQIDGDDCDTGNILEVDIKYPKKLYNFHNDLPILKYWRLKVVTSLYAICMIKTIILHT